MRVDYLFYLLFTSIFIKIGYPLYHYIMYFDIDYSYLLIQREFLLQYIDANQAEYDNIVWDTKSYNFEKKRLNKKQFDFSKDFELKKSMLIKNTKTYLIYSKQIENLIIHHKSQKIDWTVVLILGAGILGVFLKNNKS